MSSSRPSRAVGEDKENFDPMTGLYSPRSRQKLMEKKARERVPLRDITKAQNSSKESFLMQVSTFPPAAESSVRIHSLCILSGSINVQRK
jgi:hypothetical protein